MPRIPPIVSVDDHVVEPADLWQRWLPERFREAGPKVVRRPWEWTGAASGPLVRPANEGPEADWWLVDGNHIPIPKQSAAAGMDGVWVDDQPMSFADMRPGFYEARARLADMDVIGVERSLCFPNTARFCGQLFLPFADKELALACVRAYNDWMVEEWAGDSGGRLLPLCLIPLWDPVAAAAEVRRNAARGVRAVAFSELPALLGLPSIHARDGHWLPFFEACDETGTVLCIHIGSSSSTPSTSADAPKAVHIATVSTNSQLCLVDWLFSGLLARFANLKLALSESQIGWMPYVLERVDRTWEKGRTYAHIPDEIDRPPSSYLPGRVFGCFFEDDFGLASSDAIGIDQITFETDYPHQDTTWPDTRAYVEATTAKMSDEDVYKVLRGNALTMLGLPDELLV